MSERGLVGAEIGTRWIFGKPYHWTVEDGHLVLRPGLAPESEENVDA